MNDRKVIYIDECGYTGDNLIDEEQPFFVLASIDFSADECKTYKNEFFDKVKSLELKHSQLCRRPSNQKRIIEFVKELRNEPANSAFSVIYKDYCIVAKMVDFIIENVLIDEGIDIYKDGANLAITNLLFNLLKHKTGKEYFRSLLCSFQDFVQKRTAESYDIYYAHFSNNFGEELEHFYPFFRLAKQNYGLGILEHIPPDSLDIALTSAVVIMNRWKLMHNSEFLLIHDASSNMADQKTYWDKLVSPKLPQFAIGYDRRVMNFPIAVGETRFAESKDFAGLQLCDILAGAMTRCYKWILAKKPAEDVYAKELSSVFEEVFWVHNVIPEAKVTPEELGCNIKSDAKPVEHLGALFKDISV